MISNLDTLVLCGGRGSRLHPLTDTIPKPMVPFHGRPMLDHILSLLQSKGLNRFTLCIGYKGEVIRSHYHQPAPNLDIRFSDAGESTGMLRRLAEGAKGTRERFLCVYGDTFIDLDLDGMIAQHQRLSADMTIVTSKVRNPFGLVRSDADGRVTFFEEKPLMTYYIGCFIAERRALEKLPDSMLDMPDGQGLVMWLQTLAQEGLLASYDHDGLQISFNTHTEREQMEEALLRYYTISEER